MPMPLGRVIAVDLMNEKLELAHELAALGAARPARTSTPAAFRRSDKRERQMRGPTVNSAKGDA